MYPKEFIYSRELRVYSLITDKCRYFHGRVRIYWQQLVYVSLTRTFFEI
jgi:hypothetical protein